MACDVSWKAKLSTLHDENVLLKHQVESTVNERENIKLKFQRLFNSIKATRAQHQNEINEMIENVNQKTYAYTDVGAQNQDLLMTISELKSKLRMIEKRKNVNTKFDTSETLGKLLCVTPFNKNLANKAKNMSNTNDPLDRSKLVTSQSTPIIAKKQKHNANVIARGMYKINQQDTKTLDSKANTNVSNSTGVGNSNCVRRSKSKDNKSKNSVLKKTKSSSTYVWKTTNSVSLDSNKCETKTWNVCQTNACITNSMTVTAVNDGLNILKSSVKIALFISLVATKSKGLGATSVVAKSRFSVAKTPAVIQLVLWIVDSGCSKHMTGNLQMLRNFVEKFMGIVRFGNDHFAAIIGYGDYNLEEDDLLTGSRDSNLYTISIFEMALLLHVKASKFKYNKDHLCSASEQGTSKKASLSPKLVPSTESKLELLHMDFCRPIRVTSINGKKYILVIVDDYSWYTWVSFLRTKDEAPNMIIDFVNQVQRNLKAQILMI
ncbi:integrase, catalytic region, zinc finger, CCHC-type containing protein [Tanacetum coccineum]